MVSLMGQNFHWPQMTLRQFIWLGVRLYIAAISFSLLIGMIGLVVTSISLKKTSQLGIKTGLNLTTSACFTTASLVFNRIPTLNQACHGFLAGKYALELRPFLTTQFDQLDSAAPQSVPPQAEIKQLSQLNQALTEARPLIERRFPSFLIILDDLVQASELYQLILQRNHSVWLVIFQNSQELRPTGGFMGSYARVEFNYGKLTAVKIEDIYQPAGQFKGKIEAPPGVKEYLSGGEGLKLQDANWFPDFPTSAQTILNFFAWGNEKSVDGLITVNLSVAEQLLDLIGSVDLYDFGDSITAGNLAEAARSKRYEFFPGSQQKAHFLSQLANQIKFKIEKQSVKQQLLLAKIIDKSIKNKEIQFFSTLPNLQQEFILAGWSGQISEFQPGDLFFYPVEANVGINKANRNIDRSLTIQQTGTMKFDVTLRFWNRNPSTGQAISAQSAPVLSVGSEPAAANHLAYINYQRFLLPEKTQIEAITINNQPATAWRQDLVTAASGQIVRQVGGLILVLEDNEATVTISLSFPNESQLDRWYFFKQSGIEAIPYRINLNQGSRELLLEHDQWWEFK